MIILELCRHLGPRVRNAYLGDARALALAYVDDILKKRTIIHTHNVKKLIELSRYNWFQAGPFEQLVLFAMFLKGNLPLPTHISHLNTASSVLFPRRVQLLRIDAKVKSSTLQTVNRRARYTLEVHGHFQSMCCGWYDHSSFDTH